LREVDCGGKEKAMGRRAGPAVSQNMDLWGSLNREGRGLGKIRGGPHISGREGKRGADAGCEWENETG